MNEEKFISIEYTIWKNKYLPMEERIKELERQLRIEKESKTLEVCLDVHTMYMINRNRVGAPHERIKVATVIPKITGKCDIQIKEELTEAIYRLAGTLELPHFTSVHAFKQLNEFKREERELQSKLDKIPKIIKSLFKIKL